MKTNPTMQAEAVLPTRSVSENGKINILTRLAYGGGDVACNVWQQSVCLGQGNEHLGRNRCPAALDVPETNQAVVGTILPYYCKYVFHNDSWMYSTLYLSETIVLIVGILYQLDKRYPTIMKELAEREARSEL